MVVEFSDSGYTLEVETSNGGSRAAVMDLARQIHALLLKVTAATPISEFRFWLRDAGDEFPWRYQFETIDGRRWRQDVDFSGESPRMTFSGVDGGWMLAEFAPYRELRLLVFGAHTSQSLVRVEATYA